MNNLFSRMSLALACAMSIAACGGGDGNLQLGGSVSGLTKDGLVLTNKNNGDRLAVPANSSSFYMPKLLAPDDDFDIEFEATPSGTDCKLVNDKGRIGAYSLLNLAVVCVNVARELSGTVTGLKGDLVLNNGNIQVKVSSATGAVTPFSFATKDPATGKITAGAVGQGDPYGVTVLSKPADQTCTVANGTGVMGEGYGGVAVTCQ